MQRWRTGVIALGIVVVILLVTVSAIGANGGPVGAIVRSAAHAAGYDVAWSSFGAGLHDANARDVVVKTKSGEQLLTARRLHVTFNLRDLLPGGSRRFGLVSVELTDPHATVVHHRDGTYNIPLPAKQPTTQTPGKPAAPLDLVAHLTGGTVELVDEYTAPPQVRRQTIENLNVTLALHPAAPSNYAVRFALDDGHAHYPVFGNAKIDPVRGNESHHWTAKMLPIGPLVDFALSTHVINLTAGDLHDVDARYFGLPGHDGQEHRYLGAHARLTNGTLYLEALAKPLRNATGDVYAYSDGLVAPRMTATLAGVPLRLAGGAYDFSAPRLRIGGEGTGSLEQLKTLSSAAVHQPLRGPLHVAVLIEGPLQTPAVVANATGTSLAYGTIPLSLTRTTVGIYNSAIDIVDASARYGAFVARPHAVLVTQDRHTASTFSARATGPASSVPYLAQVVPGLPLDAVVSGSGVDSKVATTGVVSGNDARNSLIAPFALTANGVGNIGPLALTGPGGERLDGRVHIDRPADRVIAVVDAANVRLVPAATPSLPGLRVPALPPLDGVLAARGAAVVSRGSLAFVAGDAHVRGAHVSGVAIDRVDARFDGDAGETRVADATASGAWGRLDANGAVAGGDIALQGTYRGSLDALAAIGNQSGIHGTVDAPVALLVRGNRTTVQVRDARFANASLRGVPLQAFSGTIALANGAYDIYAARADVAGGTAVAAGRFGNGGRVGISADNLALASLPVGNAPVAGGRLSLGASIGGTTSAPTANASVALANAQVRSLPARASTGLQYGAGRLTVDNALVMVDGASAVAGGRVDGLALGKIAPRYDLDARLNAADIATLNSAFRTPLRYPEGSLAANVHIGGAGSAPVASGALRIPEGAINGLAFRNASTRFTASPGRITAQNGTVAVGSSQIAFAGAYGPNVRVLNVDAPHLNLADFNDYFDASDTLGGRGSARVALDAGGTTIVTNGRLALDNLRYKRFALGTTNAQWTTRGRTIATVADVRGTAGNAHVAGTVTTASIDPLRDPLRRSALNLTATTRGVALGTWLPALGVNAPVLGSVDADATVRGRYPALALGANAALRNGLVNGIPVNALTVAATATNGIGHVTAAHAALANLTVDANGTFGFRPTDRLALAAHAQSSDIGALARTFGAKMTDLGGSATSDLRVGGTLRAPTASDAFAFTNLRYADKLFIPSTTGTVAYDGRTVALQNGHIALLRGSIDANGSVPLANAPRLAASLRPIDPPVRLALAVNGVDLSQFSSALGNGTRLGGILGGSLAVNGTVLAPDLAGRLVLQNGQYVSNFDRAGFGGARATLTFAGTGATLSDFHASAGPGTIDGSGTARIADLSNPLGSATYSASLRANRAGVDNPTYFRGILNGALAIARTAGGIPTLSGTIAASNARIPLSAIYNPNAPQTPATAPPLPIAFNLTATAAHDVRVQSSNVDVGATGTIAVGGTLAQPSLGGGLVATDGTLNFYRSFTLQRGSVRFEQGGGIAPYLRAVATTHIPDPSTDISISVNGPPDNLNVAFASDQGYDRAQILGLLVNAQAIGAVPGVSVANAQGSGNPSGISLNGVAQGVVLQQFQRQLFEPISAALGQSLGFNALSFNYDPTAGGFTTSFTKRLGQHLQILYNESFGYPQRSSFGLALNGPNYTAAQLSFFTSQSQQSFGVTTPFLVSNGPQNYQLSSVTPVGTGNGFVFTFVKKFP